MFMGVGRTQNDNLPDESDFEAHRIATKILAANAKRYYFGDLQIVPSQVSRTYTSGRNICNFSYFHTKFHLSEAHKSRFFHYAIFIVFTSVVYFGLDYNFLKDSIPLSPLPEELDS